MKPVVYVESSVISYLTSDPSRDLIVAANQKITQEWWQKQHARFHMVISEVVLQEIRLGDRNAAHRRLVAVKKVRLLPLTSEAITLAQALMTGCSLPPKAMRDALHIALATVHAVDYLVTWNCAHIANAELRGRLAGLAERHGYPLPNLCTPMELMGG